MLIRGEIVKNTFTFIISGPEVVFQFCNAKILKL